MWGEMFSTVTSAHLFLNNVLFFWQAFESLRALLLEAIFNYFEDVNLRNLLDFVQADVSVFYAVYTQRVLFVCV